MAKELSVFEQLRKHLHVNVDNLDDEWIGHPAYVQDISGFHRDTERERDMHKHELAKLKAVMGAAIKEADPKASEASINRDLAVESDIIEMEEKLLILNYDVAMWAGLADGARTKTDALKKLSDMVLSGFTPSNSYDKMRAEQATARRSARTRLPND